MEKDPPRRKIVWVVILSVALFVILVIPALVDSRCLLSASDVVLLLPTREHEENEFIVRRDLYYRYYQNCVPKPGSPKSCILSRETWNPRGFFLES